MWHAAGEDDSDLYLEERETALLAAQDEKRKVHVTIPGMLNPHEIPEEMQDWGEEVYIGKLCFTRKCPSLNFD